VKREIRNPNPEGRRKAEGSKSECEHTDRRCGLEHLSIQGLGLFGPSGFGLRILLAIALLVAGVGPSLASPASALFQDGLQAYRAGEYSQAAMEFYQSAARRPASGTLQNLGVAQWQQGQTGWAVLAWEQALWLDPFNRTVHGNLRFARKMAQLEAPELAWYEVVSTWLPVNWWACLAGFSLWLAVAMVVLPGVLRRRRTAWQQAVAALALMVFLLSIPAHVGVQTRSHLGFILEKDTPLRLTPTREAQAITRLAAGEAARYERVRGPYLLIRTSRALGWVEQAQFGLICNPR
jgi:hypothetical protein